MGFFSHIFHEIFSNPITQPLTDLALVATGNPEFIPFANAAETYAGGGNLGQSLLSGGEALAGQELAGSFGIGSGNSLFNNALGIATTPESTGLPDLGSGLKSLFSSAGDGLSNFTNSTGLSSMFGGTAQPTGNLTDFTQNYAAPNPDVTAGAAAAPPGISSNYLPATGAPAIGGGAAGGGFNPADAGESSALPSATGIGASGLAGQGQDSLARGRFNFDPNGNAAPPAGGIGSGVGAPPASGLGSLLSPANSPSTGGFNYDNIGNPAGLSSYSAPDMFAAASKGGSKMDLSSLIGGQGGASPVNGLMRAGLGYLLSNTNQKGYQGVENAANQAAAGYQPYLQAGQSANNTLQALYGLNGDGAQAAAQGNWQNTPGYQFALDQGLKAVNADAAAKGQLVSGNNQQAIQKFGTGLANQTYNNYLTNLQGMASGGQNAAQGVGSALLTGAGAGAQAGQAAANNQNMAVGGGLNALFPQGMDLSKILPFLSGASNNGGLLSLYG